MSHKTTIEFGFMGNRFVYTVDLLNLTMIDERNDEFTIKRKNSDHWVYRESNGKWFGLNSNIVIPLEKVYQEYLKLDKILLGESE